LGPAVPLRQTITWRFFCFSIRDVRFTDGGRPGRAKKTLEIRRPAA
jgi:hypothetical protein